MRSRKTCLLVLGLSIATAGIAVRTAAQTNNYEPAQSERRVPDTAWTRLTAPPAYAYRATREGIRQPAKEKPYKPPLLSRIIQGIISFFGTTLGTIILWSVLLGIVAYVVWRVFLRGGRFAFNGAKKLAAAEGDPDEADLQNTSWQQLMDEAVVAGYLRAAVRYGYLHLLQNLAERDLIQYRPGKTNGDYATELAGTSGATDFRAVSRSYEYTWYGSYPITAPQFDAYRARIMAIQNGLRG